MKELSNSGNDTFREKRIGNLWGYTGGNYAGNVYDQDYIGPSIMTCQGGQKQPIVVESEQKYLLNREEDDMHGYRIRKLTPRECFRLQGMTSDDTDKCSAVGVSNTQLYKQAGNGIVTNCIDLLFEHLYKAQYDEEFECYDENFTEAAQA